MKQSELSVELNQELHAKPSHCEVKASCGANSKLLAKLAQKLHAKLSLSQFLTIFNHLLAVCSTVYDLSLKVSMG